MKYLNISIIFLVLSSLNVSNLWGQPPDLRSAEGFSVFTGVGAFNVTGPSSVTGDVGTNAGAFNGFPPGILSGQKYVENTVSQQASLDVGLLYDDLFARTCDSVILVAMGNGQILTPGIYCAGAASKIAGSLIFDGQNDPNSIFIIQIDGTFSSAPNTMMTLINGASSCNVFWQINGMLTLSGNTRFKGNAVVQGAVSLLDSARVEGRILVTSGAINMASNVVTPCITALPIDLISFVVKLNIDKKSVSLLWQTASESNSAHFMIEKAADGLTFDDLTKISAKGNSQTISNYSFIDVEPYIGVNYYRLKQIDADGSFVYSNLGRIDFTPIHIEWKVFPNPVSDVINIEVMTDLNTEGLIFELFGSDGKMVKSVQLINLFYSVKMNDLPSGQYFYVLKNSETIFKRGTLFSLLK